MNPVHLSYMGCLFVIDRPSMVRFTEAGLEVCPEGMTQATVLPLPLPTSRQTGRHLMMRSSVISQRKALPARAKEPKEIESAAVYGSREAISEVSEESEAFMLGKKVLSLPSKTGKRGRPGFGKGKVQALVKEFLRMRKDKQAFCGEVLRFVKNRIKGMLAMATAVNYAYGKIPGVTKSGGVWFLNE